jgi:hypothetical protein
MLPGSPNRPYWVAAVLLGDLCCLLVALRFATRAPIFFGAKHLDSESPKHYHPGSASPKHQPLVKCSVALLNGSTSWFTRTMSVARVHGRISSGDCAQSDKLTAVSTALGFTCPKAILPYLASLGDEELEVQRAVGGARARSICDRLSHHTIAPAVSSVPCGPPQPCCSRRQPCTTRRLATFRAQLAAIQRGCCMLNLLVWMCGCCTLNVVDWMLHA